MEVNQKLASVYSWTQEREEEWVKAMQGGMNSLDKNYTFDLVKLPKRKKALRNNWVYKLKTEEGSSKLRYKARLVLKGYDQEKGIDFKEIFVWLVKMLSFK